MAKMAGLQGGSLGCPPGQVRDQVGPVRAREQLPAFRFKPYRGKLSFKSTLYWPYSLGPRRADQLDMAARDVI